MTPDQRTDLVKRMAAHPRASIRAQARRMRGADDRARLDAARAEFPEPQWEPGELAALVQDILTSRDCPEGVVAAGDALFAPNGMRVTLRPREVVTIADVAAVGQRLREAERPLVAALPGGASLAFYSPAEPAP
jgi:hypothetical protein